MRNYYINLAQYPFMPPTIRIRKGDTSSIQYQIMDFDEVTSSLLPVDLSNKNVYYSSYIEKTSESPTVNDPCDIIDADQGWVEHKLTEDEVVDIQFMQVKFNVEDKTSGDITIYPRYDAQYIYVME